jgi:putative PEP-CTERM system histidine kinase
MGVGGLLGYDLFVYSDSLLFGRVDPLLHASRGAVKAIAAPLIAVAAARNAEWSAQLHVSRRAVQNSVVLIGTGVYLLGLGAAGTLLRALEGDWARLLEVAFLFCGAVLLALLLFSTRLRISLRERVSRYLFTYRHDYREQWQRFSEAFSAAAPNSSLRERAFQAVAGVVGSEHGGTWLLDSDLFVRVVSLGLPREAGDQPLTSRFSQELAERGDQIIELSDEHDAENAQEMEWLPEWLRGGSCWLLIPLVRDDAVMGFIVLSHPPVRRKLHWEDRELLQTVASQAASYLAEEQKTRALEESRRFEELSRGLAFMAHDLRNLANELSLTLSNARKHIHKPEFQRDMLLSMEESVGAMQRLLDRLRARAPVDRPLALVDLTRLLGGWLRRHFSDTPTVQLYLDNATPLPIVGDGDRVVAISGHLIQNAIDAAGPEGHVTLRLHRDGNMSLLEVADDGCGMSPAFVRERLLRPFGSSKSDGMGLGLYECGQIARELGGDLAIDSEPGRGTVVRLRLPLAPDATREMSSSVAT